jgi:hypothetical protein
MLEMERLAMAESVKDAVEEVNNNIQELITTVEDAADRIISAIKEGGNA